MPLTGEHVQCQKAMEAYVAVGRQSLMVVTVLAVSGVPGNVPQSLGKKVCILANLGAC